MLGGTAGLTVSVHNTSTVVDQLRLEVLGTPSTRTTVTPPLVGLMPGEDASIHVAFSPPRDPDLLLEEVPFAVKVTSEADPTGSVVEEGSLRIGAFRELTADLKPRKATARRRVQFEPAASPTGKVAALIAALLAMAGSRPDSPSL